jgi:hypothetical protein
MFVYLDESGDTGFKFDRGSSRYFVVTLLLVDDPVPLHAAIERLRDALRYSRNVEFKFSKSSERVRREFLAAISPEKFEVRALIVDKQQLAREQLRDKETFYNLFVRLVLDYDFGSIREAILILDESVRSKRAKEGLRTYLRRMLSLNETAPKLSKIIYHRSHTDYLLQVSDMVCGAIYAAYNKGDGSYRQMFAKHIADERRLSLGGELNYGPSI